MVIPIRLMILTHFCEVSWWKFETGITLISRKTSLSQFTSSSESVQIKYRCLTEIVSLPSAERVARLTLIVSSNLNFNTTTSSFFEFFTESFYVLPSSWQRGISFDSTPSADSAKLSMQEKFSVFAWRILNKNLKNERHLPEIYQFCGISSFAKIRFFIWIVEPHTFEQKTQKCESIPLFKL